MRTYYVIESVMRPGTFWCNSHERFKGWLYASKYAGIAVAETYIKEIINKEPCKLTLVYDS